MTPERSLLERLKNPGRGQRRGTAEPSAIVESVTRHLNRMLNVRQGSVVTLPDYGLPDLTDLAGEGADLDVSVQEAVRHMIETYEPRLEIVAVRKGVGNNPLVLIYEIAARLVQGAEPTTMRFSAKVSDHGHVNVEAVR
jgi:type VI secretion system protein